MPLDPPRPARLLLIATLLAGCGTCRGGPPAALRVHGPFPYVRCLAADPPDDREWRMGGLRAILDDGVLELEGAPSPTPIAAFSGPAPFSRDLGDALAALDDARLLLVLGDLGDSEAEASRNLAALAATGKAVLFLPGGRDDAVVVRTALAALGEGGANVVDAAPLERVVIGRDEFIPVAGAPDGRYARMDTACGYSADDLDDRAEAVGDRPSGRRRWLLSWAAPEGIGPSLAGAEAGDPALDRLARRVGASGGVFAWPRELAGLASGGPGALRVVVRPLTGPVSERGDGSRVTPGATLLVLAADGLAERDPEPAGEPAGPE